MTLSSQHSLIALVDTAIMNARNAGQEPSPEIIALFWNIAKRDLSAEEIRQAVDRVRDSRRLANAACFDDLSRKDIDLDIFAEKVATRLEILKDEYDQFMINRGHARQPR